MPLLSAIYSTGTVFVNDEEGATEVKKWNVGPMTGTESILDGMTPARQEGEDGCNDVYRGVVLNDYRVSDQYESVK